MIAAGKGEVKVEDAFARKRIDKTVEIVCQRGCDYVRQVITSLEIGTTDDVAELREQEDRIEVLTELKAIMCVYDESGGSCCPVSDLSSIQSGIKKASR